MLQERHDEARNTLMKLHTRDEANIETAQIQAQTEVDKTLQSSYWSMFAKRSYRKRTLIGMGTMAAIQTSGILVINSKFRKNVFLRIFFTNYCTQDYGPLVSTTDMTSITILSADNRLDLQRPWLQH